MAVGFYVAANHQSPLDSELAGCFHSDELQGELLPFFQSGKNSVDPWDGGEFQGAALTELKANLQRAIIYFREQPANLDFSNALLKTYYKRARHYGFDLLPPREQGLVELEKALQLTEYAITHRETLFFIGD